MSWKVGNSANPKCVRRPAKETNMNFPTKLSNEKPTKSSKRKSISFLLSSSSCHSCLFTSVSFFMLVSFRACAPRHQEYDDYPFYLPNVISCWRTISSHHPLLSSASTLGFFGYCKLCVFFILVTFCSLFIITRLKCSWSQKEKYLSSSLSVILVVYHIYTITPPLLPPSFTIHTCHA